MTAELLIWVERGRTDFMLFQAIDSVTKSVRELSQGLIESGLLVDARWLEAIKGRYLMQVLAPP